MAESTRGIPAPPRGQQAAPRRPDPRHETVYDPKRGGYYPPEKGGKR
ncbi:hypothetical protein OG824_04150 [Streptomyces prunicolor]|nr:hypothetical protein [Streptomyces prunicolor]MCX5234425.1 hypothetical protein [Streptomyces prunicolor]